MGSSSKQSSNYDLSFKMLMIGDPAVGKSSLLNSFISTYSEGEPTTIGADFKIKHITVGGKKLKLTFWDIGGQQRFTSAISSYYKNVQGIILVYDVTRRETFTNLSDVWAKQVELYCTNQDYVKIIVGNKVDKDSERVVSTDEGMAVAKELKSLFIECSAKTRVNVDKCFEDLALEIIKASEAQKPLPGGGDDVPKPEDQPPPPTPKPEPLPPPPTPEPKPQKSSPAIDEGAVVAMTVPVGAVTGALTAAAIVPEAAGTAAFAGAMIGGPVALLAVGLVLTAGGLFGWW